MSDPPIEELPILRELGDDLKHAFRTNEAAAARHSITPLRPPRRLLGAGGLGAAVTCGVVIAFALGLQGGSPKPASARAALLQAAVAAAQHPVPFPADTQFYYLRYVTNGLTVVRAESTGPLAIGELRTLPKAHVSVESELWSSADHPGAIKSRILSIEFETQAGRRLWERLGRPSFLPAGAQTIQHPATGRYLLGNIDLTRRQLLEMPTDPRMLYEPAVPSGGVTSRGFHRDQRHVAQPAGPPWAKKRALSDACTSARRNPYRTSTRQCGPPWDRGRVRPRWR